MIQKVSTIPFHDIFVYMYVTFRHSQVRHSSAPSYLRFLSSYIYLHGTNSKHKDSLILYLHRYLNTIWLTLRGTYT